MTYATVKTPWLIPVPTFEDQASDAVADLTRCAAECDDENQLFGLLRQIFRHVSYCTIPVNEDMLALDANVCRFDEVSDYWLQWTGRCYQDDWQYRQWDSCPRCSGPPQS